MLPDLLKEKKEKKKKKYRSTQKKTARNFFLVHHPEYSNLKSNFISHGANVVTLKKICGNFVFGFFFSSPPWMKLDWTCSKAFYFFGWVASVQL